MIGALKSLFEPAAAETDEARAHRMRLAAAALLIETAQADFTQDEVEEQALKRKLREALELSTADIDQLVSDAQDRVDESTSLYEFTRVINDCYSPEQKLQLVDAMWAVAYADGQLNKYEEHLVRQVAELTYVPHADYIRSKLAAAR